RRVLRVSLDLGGSARVAFDQSAAGVTAERQRGGEEERLARHDVLRLADVGHDPLVSGAVATGPADAGQRHRRRHELQEPSAADAAGQRTDPAWELVSQPALELGRLRVLLEAAPERPALLAAKRFSQTFARPVHRWHVVQSVKPTAST